MTKSRTFDIQCDVKASWKGSKEFFGNGSSWSYRKRKFSTLYTDVWQSSVHCASQVVLRAPGRQAKGSWTLSFEHAMLTTSGGSTAVHEATSIGTTAMHERTSGETTAA